MLAASAAPYGGRGAEAEAVGQLAARLHERGARLTLVLPDGPETRSSSLARGHARRELLTVDLGGRALRGELWRCDGDEGLEVCVAAAADLGDGNDDPSLADLRAGFLAAAALEVARRGDEAAILHLHGWAGAVAAVLFGAQRERWPELGAARSVLTLYTPEERQRFPRSALARLGLPPGLFHPHLLEERGSVSFLEGGAVFADAVVLPSPRAARELTAAPPGGGVEGALAARGSELRGILHGLDAGSWDPQRDAALAAPFSAARAAGKSRSKAALQSELGLLADAKAPLVVFVGEMTADAGFDLVLEALSQVAVSPPQPAQWALIGHGDRALEQRARAAARAQRGTVAVALDDDERLARLALGAADFALFPARRAWDGTWALRALRYGAIPVARSTGALAEIVRPAGDDESAAGNGLVFRTASAPALARAIDRALALHGKPGLRRLRRAAMEVSVSWAGAVRRYEELYREVAKRAPRQVEVPDLPPEPLTSEPAEPYIDWGPPLPERYGEDALEVLVQSPRSLFLYWELSAATLAAAGGDIRLRLREAGPVDAVRELAAGLPEMGEWWLEAEPGRVYLAELVAGDGRVLRQSAEAATPRESPAPRGEAQWVRHEPPPARHPEHAPAPAAGRAARRGRPSPRVAGPGAGEPALSPAPGDVAAPPPAPAPPFPVPGREELGAATRAASHFRRRRAARLLRPGRAAERSVTRAAGYLCLVLHSHLPYVRHPEHEDFLEEDWLFEGVTETYVPLLRAGERLDAEGVRYRLTIGVTPPLAAMLGDPLLQGRYRRHLDKLRELVAREVRGNPDSTPVGRLARFYSGWLAETSDYVESRWGGNLLDAFRDAQERGSVELITSTATHGFLPLMSSDLARRAQVRVGCEAYRQAFGRDPRGIWLGECAYARGVDRLLAEEGIEYFFLDAHGLHNGDPRPVYGVFAPVRTPGGACAFARDAEAAKQVWSAQEGYPGDPHYREFYRDLGWDADYDYIRPALHADGIRRGVGLKYHRVTGDVPLHRKAFYDPEAANQRAALHAAPFRRSAARAVPAPAPAHGPAAGRRGALRRRALRALVVRGAGLPRARAAPGGRGLRPRSSSCRPATISIATRSSRPRSRRPRPGERRATTRCGSTARPRRSTATSTTPSAAWRSSPSASRRPADRAGRPSTRRRASSCWRSRATGRSSSPRAPPSPTPSSGCASTSTASTSWPRRSRRTASTRARSPSCATATRSFRGWTTGSTPPETGAHRLLAR